MSSPVAFRKSKLARFSTWSPTAFSTSASNTSPYFRWHLLPTELKQRVIYFACAPAEGHLHGTQIRLGLVSKEWRQLTLRTPALWTKLVVLLDTCRWYEDLYDRHYRGCFPKTREPDLVSSARYANEWLSRAGTSTTTLNVILIRPGDPDLTRTKLNLYHNVFTSLLMPPVAQHLGDLCLNIHPNVFPVVFRTLLASASGFLSLRRLRVVTPNLDSLDQNHVELFDPNDIITATTNLFPALTDLGLTDGANTMRRLLLQAAMLFPLSQLTVLAIKSVHRPDTYWDDVLTFLQPCEHLVRLEFSFPGWEDHVDQIHNPFATIPRLVGLPSVEVLAIELVRPLEDRTHYNPNINPIFHSLTLPALKELHIFNTMITQWTLSPAKSIVECYMRSRFSLHSALVDGINWDTTDLLELLANSKTLRVLSLTDCAFDWQALLRALALKKSTTRHGEETHPQPTLLPSLRTFEFVASWDDRADIHITPEEVLDLLESRWDVGFDYPRHRQRVEDHCRQLEEAYLVFPPPLHTFDMYDQKSMEVVTRLREEGMKLTLTKEERDSRLQADEYRD